MDIMIESEIHFPVRQAASPLFVGLNLGGTYLKIGVIDNEGRVVSFFATPHYADRGPDEAIAHAAEAIQEALKATGVPLSAIEAVGFSFPGALDPKTETLYRPPNLPNWQGYPVVEKLSQYCGTKSVFFSNNANAAAYAEYWVGASQGTQSSCLLLLDKGIGCGIIVEGKEITGANGYGGEFGHIIVDPSPGARWCNCLQQGHLEAYCSSTALARRTVELLQVGHKSSLVINYNDDIVEISRKVYEAANLGDDLATRLIIDTAKFLGLGIVTLLHTLDPECVLLGGEMMFGGRGSKIGNIFIGKVREEIEKRSIGVMGRKLKLDYADLGSYASTIGAAGLAREQAALFSVIE